MQYRKFGRLGFEVSALGFGAMRLPTKEGKINEEEAARMLRYAIDCGVNYVDTAYPYHDQTSEGFVGRALQDGYRKKVKVATKLPVWLVDKPEDLDKFLNKQLERLQMDYVDFYLLHSLNRESWYKIRDLGVLDWAEKAMADGRFRHLGFSFHGDYEEFVEIIDAYNWEMCQIQYNYMDIQNQAGVKGLKYAADKGLAVVIMEPLLGGRLVGPPQPVQQIWDQATNKRTPAGWGLHWLWNQPEISTVLSGMSNLEQVKENVALAADSGVGVLNDEELALYDQVRAKYRELTAISCTNCRYCMPCPQGVDIPKNFKNYNDGIMFNKPESARGEYAWWKYAYEVQKSADTDIRAENCIQCQQCESKCPQKIPISKWMKTVAGVLGENKPYVTRLE